MSVHPPPLPHTLLACAMLLALVVHEAAAAPSYNLLPDEEAGGEFELPHLAPLPPMGQPKQGPYYRAALVVVWMGPLPWYTDRFVASAQRCQRVADFIVFTDDTEAASRSRGNVRFKLLPRAEPGRLSDKPLRLSGIVEGDSQFQRA